MTNRFKTALDIQDACNPSGVAYAFIDACKEAREEGFDTRMLERDPALRLIAFRLADLMDVFSIENSFDESDLVEWRCRKQVERDGFEAAYDDALSIEHRKAPIDYLTGK